MIFGKISQMRLVAFALIGLALLQIVAIAELFRWMVAAF